MESQSIVQENASGESTSIVTVWEILLRGNWWPMDPALQGAINAAAELGHNVVQYTWPRCDDKEKKWDIYEFDLDKFKQTNCRTLATHSIRRVKQTSDAPREAAYKRRHVEAANEPRDEPASKSIESQIWLHGKWQKYWPAEIQEAMVQGFEKGHEVIYYDWPFLGQDPEWVPYMLDLKELTQTNCHTGTKRPIRMVQQPTFPVDIVIEDCQPDKAATEVTAHKRELML